ncbi:MAG: tetratricopeptide repeat protein, partial [Bacteroidia bacterium]
MKKTLLLLIGILGSWFSGSAQTEEDFERINNEAFEAYEAYDFRTAIDKEHILLKWLKKPKLKNDTNEVIVYLNLGGFYQNYQNYDSAHLCLEKSRKLCEEYFGKKNEYYVNIVLQLGGFYEAIDLLEEAETINADAIRQIDAGATEDEWLMGAIYSNQAIVKKKLFKLKEALDLLEKSEILTIKASGRKSTDYANLLNTKSLIYGIMGEAKKEEKLLLEAMAICRELKSTKESLYGTLLNNLATMYSERGDYEQAIRSYEESYRIRASIYTEKSLECALVQANEGVALADAGKYDQGITMVKSAQRTTESLLGKFHPEWFEKAMHLGNIYEKAGMYEEADRLYAVTIREAEQNLGKTSGTYLGLVSNASLYYMNRNQYDKSSSCFDILLASEEFVSDDFALTLKGNYANFLHATGRSEEAGKYYDEVIKGWAEFKGPTSYDYLLAKHNKATYLLDLGDLAEAKALFIETRATLLEVAGPKTEVVLSLNENLAGLYKDEKEYAKALALFQEVLAVRMEESGGKSMEVADLLGKMATCYTSLDQPDKALELMEQAYAMKVSLVGKDDPSLSYETTLLATSYTYSGDYKKGLSYYSEAKRLITGQFNTYFRFMTEKEKLQFLTKTMSELKQLQAIAVENVKEYPAFGDLALEIELMMKGMVLESGDRIKHAVVASKDPQLERQYTAWQDLRTQITVEMAKPEKYRRSDLESLNTKVVDMEKGLVSKLGSLELLDMETHSWKNIQKKLGKEEVLVEFISYKSFRQEKEMLTAIVLRGDVPNPILVPLFAEEKMAAYLQNRKSGNEQGLVNTLYGSNRGVDEVNEDVVPDEGDDSLYLLLWKPLEVHLKGMNKVYYSPSGSVHKIAVAALRDEEGKYLSERFSLHTLSTAKKLLDPSKGFVMDDVLLMGGVDYDLAPSIIAKKVNPEQGEEHPEFAMRGGNGARAW